MSERLRNNLIKYGSCVAAGLLAGVAYLSGKDFFNLPLVDQYRLLSDAFMLPGFLMVAVGLLIFLANEGSFTGIGFIAQKAVGFLIPFLYTRGRVHAPAMGGGPGCRGGPAHTGRKIAVCLRP